MSMRYRQPTHRAQHATAVHVFTCDGAPLPSAANEPSSGPTAAERASMASLGIEFDGCAFRFAGYCYSRLADAMSDARRASADAGRTEIST